MQQQTSVTKGSIVWARVQFPHQWWPALVLGTDSLGVLVFFFNHKVSPRYFIESEVVSFEDSFRWLMGYRMNVKKCETFYALLDSALKLLGRRVISSLKCRCQMPHRDDVGGNNGGAIFHGSNSSFQPSGLLGFVLKVAILPWVDTLDFVDAVRVVAQVQAFRGYCSIEQKRVYEETQKRGNDLHSSLGEKRHSVTQELVALQPEDECQILSKQMDKNLAIGSIKRLNSRIPGSEGNIEPLYMNKLQIIPQIQIKNGKAEFLKQISSYLRSLSIDPFYMVGKSLQSAKRSILRFKNTSEQDIVDTFFKNCSKMSKPHFSIPSDIMTHLSNVSRRKDNELVLCRRLPDMETTTHLTKKRRRLDQPALCDCSFKLQRISFFSSINEAPAHLQIIKSRNKEEDDSDVFISSSALADSFSSCLPQIDRVQETEGNAHISKYTRPSISEALMLEPDESIQKHNQSGICFHKTAGKFTNKVHKEDLKNIQNLTLQQSFTMESSSNSVPGTHSNNHEVEARAATIKGLGSDSTLDQRLQISSGGDTKPLKSKKSARMNLSSRSRSIKNKNLYQSDPSNSLFNSRVGEQSKTHAPFASSKSLHMKFPKNFNLPSKSELIKKFIAFGSVDYLTTKVYCYTGSACVAFFQEADAVTAYLNAKRKKVCFGEANVRFWLDPFDHKRRGSRALMCPSASESVPLKSCLKKSNSLEKDNRKKVCFGEANGRFWLDPFDHKRRGSRAVMSPSASESVPLKSCLKKSNSLKKDNRKKRYKVRFTIET